MESCEVLPILWPQTFCSVRDWKRRSKRDLLPSTRLLQDSMTCDHPNPMRLQPENQVPGTWIDFWLWCPNCGALQPRELQWVRPQLSERQVQEGVTQ